MKSGSPIQLGRIYFSTRKLVYWQENDGRCFIIHPQLGFFQHHQDNSISLWFNIHNSVFTHIFSFSFPTKIISIKFYSVKFFLIVFSFGDIIHLDFTWQNATILIVFQNCWTLFQYKLSNPLNEVPMKH